MNKKPENRPKNRPATRSKSTSAQPAFSDLDPFREVIKLIATARYIPDSDIREKAAAAERNLKLGRIRRVLLGEGSGEAEVHEIMKSVSKWDFTSSETPSEQELIQLSKLREIALANTLKRKKSEANQHKIERQAQAERKSRIKNASTRTTKKKADIDQAMNEYASLLFSEGRDPDEIKLLMEIRRKELEGEYDERVNELVQRKSVQHIDKYREKNIENGGEVLYKSLVTNEVLSSCVNTLSSISREKLSLVSAYLRAISAIEEAEKRGPITSSPTGRYYKGRKIDGPIVPWLNANYGKVMDGITFGRQELQAIDPKALTALKSYESNHGPVPLDELNLPTITGKNMNLLMGLTSEHVRAAQTAQKRRKLYEKAVPKTP